MTAIILAFGRGIGDAASILFIQVTRTACRAPNLTDGAKASGKIIVDGINVLDGSVEITDVRRRMGLLPQKPNPLPMSI